MRRLVEIGRAAAGGDVTARATLDELARSDEPYRRSLALAAVYGTRDVTVVLAALDDPSRTLRCRAEKLLAWLGDDAQIAATLARLPVHRGKRLLALLGRRGRRSAIDAFLATLGSESDPLRFDWIPLASEGVVERHAPVFFERLGPAGFQRLAKFQPAILARLLLSALGANATLDQRLAFRLHGVTRALAKHGGEHALAVLERLLQRGGQAEIDLARGMAGELLLRFPERVFDALRARHDDARPVHPPGVFGLVRYDKVAHRLGPARLAYLVEHAWSRLSDGRRARRWFLRLSADDRRVVIETWLTRGRGAWGAFLLRHVAPEGPRAVARERAFRRWSAAAQDPKGVIAPSTLAELPRDLARREARRHLHELAALESRPLERMAYAALLPFEEAQRELTAFLGHPEGDVRARAARALLGTLESDEAAVPSGLEFVLARKFEQDPVRLAMLEALAALPVRLFTSEHLERLGQALSDAFDAADRSPATTAAAERLIVRLFRVDARWGATWLTRLLEVNGRVGALGLGEGLVPREVRALEAGLAELARTWLVRERAHALIWLAQSLGHRRLRHAPCLLEALERLARELPFVGVAAAALALLRREAPARFRELVPELVAQDRSFVLLSEVARFVARYRQDLAFLLVIDRPMEGRFATGRSHWVIDFGLALALFAPEVQRTYQAQLVALATAEKTDLETQRFAIVRLARLPFVNPEPLLALARDPRQPVREIAVRQLAWLDGPEALPALLECLGDDRARWAIYALRGLFRELPRSTVVAHLRAVSMQKVTVAKEVVRLLGELGGDEAFDELVAFDRPGLHRDVRIALLRALWSHLERDATWVCFERAVNDPDWVVAARLADVPYVRLTDDAEARLASLFARVLARPEPEARLDLLNRATFLPLRDTARTLFGALLAHFEAPPDEAALAVRAALHRMLPHEVDVVVTRLRACFADRRTMTAVLPQLRVSPYASAHQREVAERVLASLADDPLAAVPRVELAGHILGHSQLFALFRELSERELLHYDVMAAAVDAIRRCVHPDLLEAALSKQSDPQLRRLGLAALVSAASGGRGWSRERRKRLEVYLADPAPLVAGAAAYVFPPARRRSAQQDAVEDD